MNTAADFWIGGRRSNPPTEVEFVWKSSVDTTVKAFDTYSEWCVDEPNGLNQLCLAMRANCGWHDLNCATATKYICEYEI